MCPDKEFLPRAPNPEDIIYDDGEQGGSGESGFEVTESRVENLVSAVDVSSLVEKDLVPAADSAVSVTNVNCDNEMTIDVKSATD